MGRYDLDIYELAENLADAVEDFLFCDEPDREALKLAWYEYVQNVDDLAD